MQSPALDPLAAPVRLRGGRRDVARLWLTAPASRSGAGSPDAGPLGPGCPLSLAPARLAVGFGPKELSPTPAEAGDSPRGPPREGPCGSPAPGATRGLGVY